MLIEIYIILLPRCPTIARKTGSFSISTTKKNEYELVIILTIATWPNKTNWQKNKILFRKPQCTIIIY